MNVLTGQRYQTITNEVKLYLQGRYGRTQGAINKALKLQAIGQEETIDCRPADLIPNELDKLAFEIHSLAESEEDVLIYAMFPEIGREFLKQRRDGTLVPEPLEPVNAAAASGNAPIPVEFEVTLHGETYHMRVDGTGHKSMRKRPFYVTVDGVPEEILLEVTKAINPDGTKASARESDKESKRRRANKPGDVTTTMPGTVIDVLVKAGDIVKAGDPVLVAEAMKMETEIHAPVAGTVKSVNVQKGDLVNPDETLIEIE